MKKSLMIIAAVVMMAGFGSAVMAQGTSATIAATPAGAVLIVPMAIFQDAPLHFGSMVLVDATGGTCVLSTANVRTFAAVGVAASAIAPLSTNAAYHVTGTMNETYALTLPETTVVTAALGTGVKTMDITAMKVLFLEKTEATYVGAASTLSATGTDSFKVGGTLTIKPSQVGGVYTGVFPVTVEYN